jgi:hypothetical protein
MKSTFVILIVLLVPLLSESQDFRPGYVVRNGNDTTRGLISYRSGRSIANCEFRTNKKAVTQTFEASDLSAFEIDLTRYESIKLETDTLPRGNVFMRVLTKGYIDLYRYKRYFFLVMNDELIGLPEPLLVEVKRPGVTDNSKYLAKDSRFIIALNQMVQDCGLNANETGYNISDMTALISAYNECKKESFPVPKKKMLKINYGAFASYGVSKMDYNREYPITTVHIPFDKCRTVYVGVGVDLSSPLVTDRLFMSFEFWYTQLYYQGYYQGPTTGGTLRQDLLFDVTYLKFPIGFRYNLAGGNNTPYIKTGLAFSKIPKYDFRVVDEVEIVDGTVYMEGTVDVGHRIKTNTRRVWLGAGYEARFDRLGVFAEVRGEYGGGFIGDFFDSKSTLIEFNVVAGVRF